MVTVCFGDPLLVPTASISLTTLMDASSATLPNTV
jgi:hypothetical protein